MPGAVPRTATMALAMGNLPYILSIANIGLEGTLNNMPQLCSGVNIYKGNITYKNLADTLSLEFKEIGGLYE